MPFYSRIVRAAPHVGLLAVLLGAVLMATSVPAPSHAETFAPTLDAPTSGTLLTDLTATLTWTTTPETTQVHLQVIPEQNDGPGIDLIMNVAQGYRIPPPPEWYGLLPDLGYTWRVRATDAAFPMDGSSAGWSAWSDEWTFRTPAASAATIRPQTPSDGSVVAVEAPFLQWDETNPRLFYYEVQVSTDPDFGAGEAGPIAPVWHNLVHGGVTAPAKSWLTPGLVNNATYYWRVRPRIQGNGAPVAWGPSARFITDIGPPAPGLSTSTLDGGVLSVASLIVAAGDQLRVTAPTTIQVAGDVDIAGSVVTDAAGLTIVAAGDVSISGSVSTDGVPASSGSNAAPIHVQAAGSVSIGGTLTTGDGAGSPAKAQSLSATGHVLSSLAAPAGSGGTITVIAAGPLTVASGAQLRTGSGASGAPAIASGASPDEELRARGGHGGGGGDITVRGSSVMLPESGDVFTLGDGSTGGDATYQGVVDGNGVMGGGVAVGGSGGAGGRLVVEPTVDLAQLSRLVVGGRGANGGNATGFDPIPAPAGNTLSQSQLLDAKPGKEQIVQGGWGGSGAKAGGDGGHATAPRGGNGSGGGNGGSSLAMGGEGGAASDLAGVGGRGGDATSKGGGDGSPGSGAGGDGGSARAVGGTAAGTTNAGRGGHATSGPGGNGGGAVACDTPSRGATGGMGGGSLAWAGRGKPGGDATASLGGQGGEGATCCKPPAGGGLGGAAGSSLASAGHGSRGAVGGDGGDAKTAGSKRAGHGGDGKQPGPRGSAGFIHTWLGRGGDGPFGKGRNGTATRGAANLSAHDGFLCAGLPTWTPTSTSTPHSGGFVPTPTPSDDMLPVTPTPPSGYFPPTSTPTPTTTAPPTVTPVATPSPTPIAGPVDYLGSAYMDVSTTDPITHITRYEVHFGTPALEEDRAGYSYGWNITLTGSDCLGNSTFVQALGGIAWTAAWEHGSCGHTAPEQISVLIERAGQFRLISGPALGPTTLE